MEDLAGKICVKCPNPAKFTGIDPKKAWYCQECFIQMVRSKFRSALSKRKIYKDAESRETIVVYDGSPSSAFLLHQIDDALRQVNFKRLMIQPTILVLVTVTEPSEIAQVTQKIKEIRTFLPDKVPWVIAHVACCLSDKIDGFGEDIDICYGADKIPEYESLLNSCKIPTYREELERILREKCLERICGYLKIGKVMVSSEADELGRLSLAQLCLGRGGSLSNLVSVVDKRDNFLMIRPLREIACKEIGIVNHLCGFENSCIQLKDKETGKSSIQKLTDQFINTLEKEKFYSTVNTVLSTAAKIHNSDESKSTEKCSLCTIEAGNPCETCSVIFEQCDSPILLSL